MKTKVSEMFGIEVPIFAFSHCRDVVAEVSKAGGMGGFGIAGFTPEQLGTELNRVDHEVGDRPCGADIMIPSRHVTPATNVGDFLQQIPVANQPFLKQRCDDADIPPLPDGETSVRQIVDEMLSELVEATERLQTPVMHD